MFTEACVEQPDLLRFKTLSTHAAILVEVAISIARQRAVALAHGTQQFHHSLAAVWMRAARLADAAGYMAPY